MQSVFNDNLKLPKYIFLWVIYAILHYLSVKTLVQFQFVELISDALICSVLYGAVGVLFIYVMKFAGLNNLNFFQRNVDYAVLFILAIVVVISINYYGMILIFGNEIREILLNLIPLKVLISILIFIIIVTAYTIIEKKESESTTIEQENNEQDIIVPEKEVTEQKETIDRIAVKSGQKIHVIPVQDIYFLQADSDYVHIFTDKNKYLKEQTMKFFEENLPASKFVRVHRSYIVNIEAISRVELYEKQTQLLSLKNGQQIKMSQSGYKLLKAKLNL